MTQPQVWFGPNLNSPDELSLFQKPQEWTKARSEVSVMLLIYAQLINHPADFTINGWKSLRLANLVQDLNAWNMALAFEMGVIKPQYLSNASAAVRNTQTAIANVAAAGGRVQYVAMDEPYFGGIKYTRWTVSAIENRIASYMRSIASSDPAVQVGDVEPYPKLGAANIMSYVDALIARGAKPAFFHLDIDYNYLRVYPNFQARLNTDLPTLRNYFAAKSIPFGVIFQGADVPVRSDQDYATYTMRNLGAVVKAMGVPQEAIFQSYIVDQHGHKDLPINLPETQPYTHTWLIDQAVQRLLSQTVTANVPPSGNRETSGASSPAAGDTGEGSATSSSPGGDLHSGSPGTSSASGAGGSPTITAPDAGDGSVTSSSLGGDLRTVQTGVTKTTPIPTTDRTYQVSAGSASPQAVRVDSDPVARSMSKIAAHTINSPAEAAAIAQSATIHIGAPSSLVAAVSRLVATPPVTGATPPLEMTALDGYFAFPWDTAFIDPFTDALPLSVSDRLGRPLSTSLSRNRRHPLT
jgi:hypothetical protein